MHYVGVQGCGAVTIKKGEEMKKIILTVLALALVFSSAAFALENTLIDMRKEIFNTSESIKANLKDTKDPILLSSMWDSSIMTVSSLDAYFYMVGIFNAIKKQDLTDSSVDYLVKWLNRIRETNDLNIRSMDAVSSTFDPKTKISILKLKGNFSDLNSSIAKELAGILQLKKANTKANVKIETKADTKKQAAK